MERAGAQRPGRLHRLQRMDDVVDLDEVLPAALLDERGRELGLLEPVELAFVQVDPGVPVHQHLGQRPRHPGRVRHPDGLGQPEPVEVRRLADQREAVGGEGEDAVDAVLVLGLGQHGQQLDRVAPGGVEVLLGERLHRRHRGGSGADLVLGDRHGAVGVGADADAVAVPAEVEVAVLVAQDRALLAQLQRARLGVLVGQGQQRHVQPGHPPDRGTPEARRAHHHVGRDRAVLAGARHRDPGDPAAALLDADHGVPRQESGPAFRGPFGLRLPARDRRRQPVARHVEPAEHLAGVERGPQLQAGGRVEQARLDAPRLGPAVLAVQVVPAFGGGGHLQAADLAEAVLAEAGVLAHGVGGEFGHGLRRVSLEDQAGGVGAGAAGGEERPLFEHGDVGPPPLGELVGEGAADDARPHDHQTGPTHDASGCSLMRNMSRTTQRT